MSTDDTAESSTTHPDADTEGVNAVVTVPNDRVEFSVEHVDGKTLAPLDQLDGWSENPRTAEQADIDRLKNHIRELGFYKPLIATTDGTVIGGNMRLRALTEMGYERGWVSVIEPEDENALVEYSMSDNDRIGRYQEEQVANLVRDYDLDVAKFKVDFHTPADLSQNLAREMEPEELLEMTDTEGSQEDAGATGEETSTTADTEERESPERNLERVGEGSSTAMVQLFMAQSEKDELTRHVSTLKGHYQVDTTSDVVQRAVRNEAERATEGDA